MTELIRIPVEANAHGLGKKASVKYRPECTDEVHSKPWHGAAYPGKKDAQARADQHDEDDAELKKRIAEAEAELARRTPADVVRQAQQNDVKLSNDALDVLPSEVRIRIHRARRARIRARYRQALHHNKQPVRRPSARNRKVTGG